MQFTVTENHLKLLRSMYVGWQGCESGAPEIDPKRPYGNSDIEPDIHEILTGETEYDLTEQQRDKYQALHRETAAALQIVLSVGKFEPGIYETIRPFNRQEWRLVSALGKEVNRG